MDRFFVGQVELQDRNPVTKAGAIESGFQRVLLRQVSHRREHLPASGCQNLGGDEADAAGGSGDEYTWHPQSPVRLVAPSVGVKMLIQKRLAVAQVLHTSSPPRLNLAHYVEETGYHDGCQQGLPRATGQQCSGPELGRDEAAIYAAFCRVGNLALQLGQPPAFVGVGSNS